MNATQDTSLAQLFRALADRTRLRLLNLIADREICVCYFVEILGIAQPKISRHLAYLRKAGIVAARRDGKWVHYRLAVPKNRAAANVLRATLQHLRSQPALRRELARLGAACCRPQRYDSLQGAPKPAHLKIGTARTR